jgi:predicted aspartyl protease
VKIVIENPIKLLREEVELLVGTGATLPWIPKKMLENIGLEPIGRKKFKTISGELIERDVSFARVNPVTGELEYIGLLAL